MFQVGQVFDFYVQEDGVNAPVECLRNCMVLEAGDGLVKVFHNGAELVINTTSPLFQKAESKWRSEHPQVERYDKIIEELARRAGAKVVFYDDNNLWESPIFSGPGQSSQNVKVGMTWMDHKVLKVQDSQERERNLQEKAAEIKRALGLS